MAKKTEINLFFDDNIAASSTDTKLSAIIPTGRKVTLKRFGGCDVAIGDGLDSIIAIQWGSSGSWQTIRGCSKSFEFEMQRDFEGDGSSRFRLVRINKSSSAKPILAWVDGIIHDA